MKMKQVLATGAALSMALSMAPVTASAADKVDINVIAAQYGQQTADWWANFVTEFNEANPDIKPERRSCFLERYLHRSKYPYRQWRSS